LTRSYASQARDASPKTLAAFASPDLKAGRAGTRIWLATKYPQVKSGFKRSHGRIPQVVWELNLSLTSQAVNTRHAFQQTAKIRERENTNGTE
jgi:hypothetical protein